MTLKTPTKQLTFWPDHPLKKKICPWLNIVDDPWLDRWHAAEASFINKIYTIRYIGLNMSFANK